MITIITNKINTLNQNSYNNFVQEIEIYKLPCSCGLSGSLIKHGYYNRHIKTPGGIINISVLRVKCKHCAKTHAILPSLIVPYSGILLKEHLIIINTHISKASFEPIMLVNEYIDESNIRYILSQFLKYWEEPIRAFDLSTLDPPSTLALNCLKTFKRQFMQIKRTINILFC